MDDAELTRLAIAEIVREMGEIKEPAVQERKVNPIAKPNKRFLGRTLNSVMSHNKRKNDRTQENCRKKLRELDERREIIKRMRSRSRSGSWELVLSSSSDEDHSKEVKKRKKQERKSKHNTHKKVKKRKSRSKRRDYSSSSSSSDSSSESSSSTSRSSSYRSKKNKSRKKSKSKKPKAAQLDFNTVEGDTEEIYYEQELNEAVEFDAALLANNCRQHQIQQLLYYNTLIAGHETSEIEALKEEMRISDTEVTETQKEKGSICSAVSSLNLNESDSDVSEVLQISLSSATSSDSEPKSNSSVRNKKVKRKVPKVGSPSNKSDATSSDVVIWELDSNSSKGDEFLETKDKKEKQSENEECICITSESETTTDGDSESESLTSENNLESTNNTNEPNTLCHAAAETVTLISSSDSEVEIINLNGANESVENLSEQVMTAKTTQFTDSSPACEEPTDLMLCVPNTNAMSISAENLTLKSVDETAQNLPDPIWTTITPQPTGSVCGKQSHLDICVSEMNAISIPNERLTTVVDNSVVRVFESISVDVNTLQTTSECTSSPIKVDAMETEKPMCVEQALMNETESLKVSESTALTLDRPSNPVTNAICKTNSGDIKPTDTDVETTLLKSCLDQEIKKPEVEISSRVVNVPPKESVDGITHNLPSTSQTDASVGSSPEAILLPPIITIDKTVEVNLQPSALADPSASSSPETISLPPKTIIDKTDLHLDLVNEQIST